MNLFAGIFSISLLILLYVYAGYPLLIRLLGGALNRRVQAPEPGSHTPTVTVLIAAFNEAKHIVQTVQNKLDQDYPPDRLKVVVVSDESEDGTDDLVKRIGDPRVTLLRQVPRAGKTSALNLAMPGIDSEVLVFSDANSLYAADTVRNLVAPLNDPTVGYVTGRMVYKAPDGSMTGEGCSTYMAYENLLRAWETGAGSIVGVDGGVDAMRRAIYRPMNADQLPDFVQPLNVREQGYRVVYEPGALLYEDALADVQDEFRMRVRVSLRAFHALKDKAALLNPFRFGIFAWQLFSHKVLRYLAFLFMLLALVANVPLALSGSSFWQVIGIAQVVFYVTALVGHGLRRHSLPRIVGLVYYLCVVNLASGLAFGQFLRGRKQVIWKPRT